MQRKPLISVCIANYNGIAVIDDCIQSVLDQTCGQPVEIIVHDDASTDGSQEYIRANFPEIILIESAENVGYCISNNRMAARASGDYLLLLNNDAALFPGAFSALLAQAETLRRPAILGLPQYEWESGKLCDRGSLLDPFLNAVPNLDFRRSEVAMVAGACLWIPKTTWDELGGFPEWFGSVGEDLHLCSLARLAGHTVHVLEISGFRHRIGTTLGGGKIKYGKLSTTFKRRGLSERNRTFVLFMALPAPFMQIALPIHLTMLLIEGVILSILRKQISYLNEIYLPTFTAIFRQRKLLSVGRQKAQSLRRISGTAFFSVFDPVPYKIRMLFKHGLPEVR